MPGMTYANDDGEWAGWCTVHDAWEMSHTCAGGEGEALGYCEAWPGDFDPIPEDHPTWKQGSPTCVFERPNYEEDE